MNQRKIKIAVADDHGLFRMGMMELLSGFTEIQVLFDAANGRELIDKIETSDQKPDICLLDIKMPVMDGFATAKYIRNHWSHIRTLAVSMYDDEFSIIKMIRNGANGYVLKDVQPEDLRKAIVTLYNKGFYHSDLITIDVVKKANAHKEENPRHIISDKELEFLRYCCTELTYKEIGEKMGNSPRTIDGYRDNLFTKLEVTSRTGLAIYAIKHGIVKL